MREDTDASRPADAKQPVDDRIAAAFEHLAQLLRGVYGQGATVYGLTETAARLRSGKL